MDQVILRLIRNVVAFLIGILEVLFAFRFILKLLRANPAAEIVSWLYTATQPFLQPFAFAFPTPSIKGGMVLEFTTLFALFAYAFIGYIIEEGLTLFMRRTT